jgi:hypothetical protein
MVSSSGLERCYTSASGSGPSASEGGDTLGGSLLDLFGSDGEVFAALGDEVTLWEGDVGPGTASNFRLFRILHSHFDCHFSLNLRLNGVTSTAFVSQFCLATGSLP